jgi:hypothetical protein
MRSTLFLLSIITLGFLCSCVQIPEPANHGDGGTNTSPSITLDVVTEQIYPGTIFRINATISDIESPNDDLTVTWASDSDNITAIEEKEGYALFTLSASVGASDEITVSAIVADPQGASANQDATVTVALEPYVVVDAVTNDSVSTEENPLYFIGAYSARRSNGKADDVLTSTNFLADISPNGQYFFYTQRFSDNEWQANILDFNTGVKRIISNMNFSNRNINALQAYWSNDSRYLAVKAPHESQPAQDYLYWVAMSDVENDNLAANRETVSFDTLVWSDNTDEEQAFAALYNDDSIWLMDPSAAGQTVVELKKDNTISFTKFDPSSPQWASNQLFFIASTTFTSNDAEDPYKTVLFRWRSSNGRSVQISSLNSQTIDEIAAYSPSKIVINADQQLWFYDDTGETQITLNGITAFDPEYTELSWSDDGQFLAVVVTPPDGSSDAQWKFITWNADGHEKVNADWADGTARSISAWAWNSGQDSVSVLGVNEMGTNTLLSGSVTSSHSLAQKISSIGHADPADNGYNLRNLLSTSPTGKWQLLWGTDKTKASPHVDLWAYNTIDDTIINVSSLKDNYLAPVEGGGYEEVNGFGTDDSTRSQVSGTVYWISEDELVFTVGPLTGKNSISDVRMINLSEDSMAHSLIANPDELDHIVRLID